MINASTMALMSTVPRVGVYPVFVATAPAGAAPPPPPVCTYSLSAGSATFQSGGGPGSVSVIACTTPSVPIRRRSGRAAR
jgi:hypothetical protein